MSQRNVERVIGQLVTDESFRHRFAADPLATLHDLTQRGLELTACEQRALVSVDLQLLEDLADAIDPRLQKADLRGEVQ